MTDEEIAAQLLQYLRETNQTDSLTYLEGPTRIRGGFESSIFGLQLSGAPDSLSGPLVLRLFDLRLRYPLCRSRPDGRAGRSFCDCCRLRRFGDPVRGLRPARVCNALMDFIVSEGKLKMGASCARGALLEYIDGIPFGIGPHERSLWRFVTSTWRGKRSNREQYNTPDLILLNGKVFTVTSTYC